MQINGSRLSSRPQAPKDFFLSINPHCICHLLEQNIDFPRSSKSSHSLPNQLRRNIREPSRLSKEGRTSTVRFLFDLLYPLPVHRYIGQFITSSNNFTFTFKNISSAIHHILICFDDFFSSILIFWVRNKKRDALASDTDHQ